MSLTWTPKETWLPRPPPPLNCLYLNCCHLLGSEDAVVISRRSIPSRKQVYFLLTLGMNSSPTSWLANSFDCCVEGGRTNNQDGPREPQCREQGISRSGIILWYQVPHQPLQWVPASLRVLEASTAHPTGKVGLS